MGYAGARTLKSPRVASGDVSKVVPADSGDHSHFEDKQCLTAMGLKYASCDVAEIVPGTPEIARDDENNPAREAKPLPHKFP